MRRPLHWCGVKVKDHAVERRLVSRYLAIAKRCSAFPAGDVAIDVLLPVKRGWKVNESVSCWLFQM